MASSANVVPQLSANAAPQPVHPGEPYALYAHSRVQYPQSANIGSQMINNGMVYPQKMFHKFDVT